MKCCICDVKFDEKVNRDNLPFCSPRCQLLDLGRWLNEDYNFFSISENEDEEDFDLPLDNVVVWAYGF